jgi:hypothetical protein
MNLLRLLRFLFVFSVFPVGVAFAGAFLQPEGMLLVMQETSFASSLAAFDSHGRLIPVSYYRRFTLDTALEYGVIDRLTLIGRIEYANVLAEGTPSGTYRGLGMSDLGARVALAQFDDYIISAQATLRLPGTRPPANPATVDLDSRDVDLRLMGGGSFDFNDLPGYWSLEAGLRQRSAGYADEWHVDVAGGVHATERLQVIAQAFTTIVPRGTPASPESRTHKLQGSLVFNPGRAWSLQAGAFFTPLAVDARRERGLMMAFWRRY